MSYYYLKTGSDTLVLEDTVSELSLGGIKREFGVTNFIGADGGVVTGSGSIGSRKFTISRKEKVESGDGSAWNSRRSDYLKWFLKNKDVDVWLYVEDGESSIVTRTLVYCTDIGSEKYKNIRISGDRSITLVSPSGVFESTTTTDYTGYTGLTGYGSITLSPAVDSMLDVPGIWTINPNATLNTAKIWIAESIGFSLAGPFSSGVDIIYDHKENTFTLGIITYNISNYLQSGGRFTIPSDTATIYYYFSASVDLDLSIYKRYI